MKTLNYKRFNERIHHFKLHDRLRVFVIEKPAFSKTYVTLSTPLGSIHRHYLDASGETVRVPEGIAHFLEHKVFEKEGEDLSTEFSEHEAQINAFTEHNRTTYLFSATGHVLDNINRLVTMFFNPAFTKEGVEKERNIIQEELNMHKDDPYYYQYHTLINQLYHTHPIKDDILGTKESINAISVEALKAMHEAYYQPEKCDLVIVGDVDIESLKATLETQVCLPDKTTLKPFEIALDEPRHVNSVHAQEPFDVMMPSVLIGIKKPLLNHDTKPARLKESLAFTIFFDLLFGKSSDCYEALLSDGLINDTYGLDVTSEASYGYALIGTETNEPNAFVEAIKAVFDDESSYPVTEEAFNRTKKQMIGSFVQALDSLEATAHQFTRYIGDNIIYYDVLEIAEAITFEEVVKHRKLFKQKNIITTHILTPNVKA